MTAQIPTADLQPVNTPERELLVDVRNQIGHLTLNRPAGLNTLTLNMIRLLQAQLDAWSADSDIRAVVLRGAGEKAFCAGGDIRSLYDSYKNGQHLHRDFFVEEYALDLTLHHYPKPVLALMDGFVLGGGMGLAQGASLRLVTERSQLAMPEVGIGYFPDVGGSYFLSRIRGEIGIYLGVSGVHIRAADALYCGLADWHMHSNLLPMLDQRLDTLIWQGTPLQTLRDLIAELGVPTLPDAPLQKLCPTIDEVFALPGVLQMIESLRAMGSALPWAEETAALLEARSPLAMAVTLESLRRGREMNLEDCFAMELHLDHQWFARGDFMEGVRALLIDKDKKPRWNPPTLGELSAGYVADFFNGFHTTRS